MRLAHLSDLHFGRHDDAVVASLADEVAAQAPDLIVVSGDFTQVGSRREFEAARAFLRTLSAPVFAVPGNHDVPAYDLVSRFLDPYALYKQYISPELEPFLAIDGVALAGIKTPRRMRLELNWSHGTIGRGQLRRLAERFAAAPPASLRVVVAHHPLLQPEQPAPGQAPTVRRADRALATFAALGVRLVLSGHFHLSYVRQHAHRGEVGQGAPLGLREAAAAPILVAQASSATSTRLRGHANAYNLIDVRGDEIDLAVREWREGRWQTREDGAAPVAPTAGIGVVAG